MTRLHDMTIKRKLVEHDSEFTRYWHHHAPDANDLAELFKISARRIRELWKEGWLTKGGSLPRAVSEWETYRTRVIGREGHVGGAPKHRG